MLAAVGTVAGNYELNASAISAVAAGGVASLAVVNRIGVDIVFRALARRIAALSPLINCIETRTIVGAAVFATFLFQLANVRVRFRSLAMMSGNTATIRCRLMVYAVGT